jgi:hypothetical protein
LKQFFGLNILKFFDAVQDLGYGIFLILDPGWKNEDPGQTYRIRNTVKNSKKITLKDEENSGAYLVLTVLLLLLLPLEGPEPSRYRPTMNKTENEHLPMIDLILNKLANTMPPEGDDY